MQANSRWLLPAAFALIQSALGAPALFSAHSAAEQTVVVELYSSEGCNSCPPADTWLAELESHPQLWRRLLPLEFHVDYWNRLGWNDSFSKVAFTKRQRDYAALWGKSTVYTPGFVLNGKEWSRDTKALDRAIAAAPQTGVLEVNETKSREFQATFHPVVKASSWILTVAVLGNDFETKVAAGENAGKTLKHRFVVLATDSVVLAHKGNAYSATLTMPTSPGEAKAPSVSLAFWVAKDNAPDPVQAVGGNWTAAAK